MITIRDLIKEHKNTLYLSWIATQAWRQGTHWSRTLFGRFN